MGRVLKVVSGLPLDGGSNRLLLWWTGAALLVGVVVAVLSPSDVLLVCLIAGVAIASLFEPLVGVFAGIILGPFRAWLAISVPQVPDQLGQGLFLLGITGWLVCGMVQRKVLIEMGPITVALLLFVSVGLLSLWSPFDAWLGFTEWAKWVQVLIGAYIVGDRLKDDRALRHVRFLLISIGVASGLQACIGIWQHIIHGEGPLHFLIAPGIYRAYGTFMQPNPFGGFLGFTGALFVGLILVSGWEAIWERRPVPDWFWPGIVVVLVIVGGLYGSWSRGAWMGFGAAMAVMAGSLPRRSLWGFGFLLVFLGGVALLLAFDALPASVEARLIGFLDYARFADVRGVGVNDANYAFIERMAHWQAALGMWQSRFWTGVGMGNYDVAYPVFRLANWPYALGHAHNFYLNLLAETGVVGLTSYLLLLSAIFLGLWRALRVLCGWRRGLTLGLLGAWTHITIHSLVDNLYVNNVHLHVAVLLALTGWIISKSRAGNSRVSGGVTSGVCDHV